jgi:ribosome-binding factor A
MENNNLRKRAAHRRQVQAALQKILNDPSIMPNADCRDLVVSVSRVEFGRTVRQIYIDVIGERRKALEPDDELPHQRYLREAEARGELTYADLTEVFLFPSLTEIVAKELQKRLGLQYTPEIRRLCDLGDA